ncbi:hypothetical protein Tco_1394543 [Tanacetum coccineum]
MVRSMMSLTTLPRSFWDYALEFAARILNMVSTRKVEKTPCEVWHGLHHDKDDEEIDEPQSDTILVRRSTRIGHALDQMQSMKDNQVGDLVDLPPNDKIVGRN